MTALDVARPPIEPAGGAGGRRISLRRELSVLPTASGEPPARRRHDDGWLDRWLDTCSDLARLQATNPMLDAVIDEVDGRRIRIGDHWLSDFASCNYLGFDLDPEIMAAIEPEVRRWGTHPSWSRLLGSPRMYEDIEDRLTELLGAPDTLVLATITHIHMSVIPVLAGGGTIFLDRRAHKTIYDGTKVATSNGARVQRYNHDDLDHLEQLLKAAPGGTRLICMDGVNSMTGNAPDLPAFAELAREHDALLYVDDAHGFGVIGERTADEPCNWGSRGNSIVRHFGESYDNVVLVGGFSKSYSSLLAFLALPSRLKNVLKIAAAPYLYSGPSPVASLATVLAGLDVNRRRGDDIRRDLYAKTTRVLDGLDALGVATPNTSGFPIIEIPLPDADQIDDVGRFLFDRGIYVTLAAFPLVPRREVGFRIQVTAANTTEDIDLLLSVLEEATDRFGLAGAWSGSAVAAGH
jgi:8-amino-7-oxononanoate synthase